MEIAKRELMYGRCVCKNPEGYIGLATNSFRFFPLDDFSRSKSFFSIANFRPYMVFDS